MSEEERKRRNYKIAGYVGGFLFPIAGAIGAAVFYSIDDRELATSTLVASLIGLLFWFFLIAAVA